MQLLLTIILYKPSTNNANTILREVETEKQKQMMMKKKKKEKCINIAYEIKTMYILERQGERGRPGFHGRDEGPSP